MSLYDQPDYSLVEHESCEDPSVPEVPACRSCDEEPAAPGFEHCTGCLLMAAFVLLQIDPGSVVEPVPGGPRELSFGSAA